MLKPQRNIIRKEIKRDPFLETVDKLEYNFEKNKKLEKVVKELKGAVKAHGRQAETIEQHIEDMNPPLKMKTSPALLKLSASCKAAARKKFKVYPSAYANMWASKTQKKGKC